MSVSGNSDALLTKLSAAPDIAAFCQTWLGLLAMNIDGLMLAMVLFKNAENNTFRPVAIWPDVNTDVNVLLEASRQVLEQQKIIQLRQKTTLSPAGRQFVPAQIAVPVILNNALQGAVVIGLTANSDENLSAASNRLLGAVGWLHQLLWRLSHLDANARLQPSTLLLEVVLQVAETSGFQAAAMTLVNSLAVRLKLKRVSLGWVINQEVKIIAISHAAYFKERQHSMQLLLNAMQEAADQACSIMLPAPESASAAYILTDDHAALLSSNGQQAAASWLLQSSGQIKGVLTLEYVTEHPPGADDHKLTAALSAMLTPVLMDKWALESWFAGKLKVRISNSLEQLFGGEHPVYRLTAGLGVLLCLLLALVPGEFRIPAKTVIEGLMQRAAVAPFDGYISQTFVRAGDRIEAGQLVASLDDRDLQLEAARLQSEAAQTEHKYREALAKHDRAAAAVLGAQLEQTRAELELVAGKLQRAGIRAPIAGYVVTGDLNQKLGAPVEQGKVLFEIAPLDAYRIILKVDERDITYIRAGQAGELSLTGIAGLKLPFRIKNIIPIAIAEEGMNFFKVEAELQGDKPLLRPGMEGVGKISAGREKLWWIGTRRFWDWLTVSLWTWLP